MYQMERFTAASGDFERLAKLYMAIKDVVGFALVEAPDTARRNPCGPQFVAYVSKRKKVDALRAAGDLPRKVKTAHDIVRVVVEKAVVELHRAHTGNEEPMKPGASIGDNRLAAGTLGARLDSPGSGDHFLTCGHVVRNGTDVHQAGLFDSRAAGRPDRKVGNVVTNALSNATGASDAASVQVDTGFTLQRAPHDSPPPAPGSPAIGLYRGVIANRPFYIHINAALASVGGGIRFTEQMEIQHKGRRVSASGRTSGLIKSVIDGPAVLRPPRDLATPGFVCDRIRGGEAGDSGAVSVLLRGQTTSWVSDAALDESNVIGTDVDDAAEYLPGTFTELDQFLSGDGTHICANGTELQATNGRNLLARLVARLRRLGELGIVVTANTYKNPCRGEETRRRRPTGVREIILRPGRDAEEPDEGPEGEEIESQTSCCTFGTSPYITIAGDDNERTEFELEVSGAAAIRVVFKISQTVMSARFRRFGQCFRNVCSEEVMRGRVTVSRTTKLEISGSLGEVDLPVIGKIRAGSGSFKREVTRSLNKNFVLPCSDPN